jgi:hypothetical protein
MDTNVVPFPAAPIEAPPIYVPLDTVEGAAAAFDLIQLYSNLAQRALAHSARYGDREALAGVAQIFEVLASALDNLRTGRHIDAAAGAAAIAWVTRLVQEKAGEDAGRAVASQLAAGLGYLLSPENREPDNLPPD